jgi:hypothetical protein
LIISIVYFLNWFLIYWVKGIFDNFVIDAIAMDSFTSETRQWVTWFTCSWRWYLSLLFSNWILQYIKSLLQYFFIGFSFLFCSPEKLCFVLNDQGVGNKLKNLLNVLYQNGVLLRSVINDDEKSYAHCVTTWGLDFP